MRESAPQPPLMWRAARGQSATVFSRSAIHWLYLGTTVSAVNACSDGSRSGRGSDLAHAVEPFEVRASPAAPADRLYWFEQQLFAEGVVAGDQFGASVAISPGTIVIGAAGVNVAQGAAYVFTQAGPTAWTERQPRLVVEEEPEGQFGISVGISGDTIVVGAPNVEGDAQAAGAAYLFGSSSDGWSREQTLTVPGTSRFGSSVAVSDGTVVVGAPMQLAPPDPRGSAAYVFERQPGDTWG